MIGLDAHLIEMESLLDLDYDGAKVVAISGPAGIGKTTIARALHSLLSDRFQLTCFVDNLRGSYHSGSDEHGLKLRLQEQFLSEVLNHNGLRIRHLGAVKENLCDQKVLIILDDVNHRNQLEALANETTWFGPGSRIVVTTENRELLQQHGIDCTYHVGFPSQKEASEILCKYAFMQSYPRDGFDELTERITKLCGNLPLGLRVVGSSLFGKKEDEWKYVMNRLEDSLDQDIEEVLRIGYESLDVNEQKLFLHIAIFFNNEDSDRVKAMFTDSNLDVKRCLNILVYRSLIEIYTYERERSLIVMHKLLQQMARQAILKQEFSKRQILMDTHEICDVLENEMGTRAVSGILFDISGISEVSISKRALKRMPNLRFLRVYKSRDDGNDMMHIHEEMEFPRRLRLLHWDAYPHRSLPPTFHPENLVKLCMRDSQLEFLWQGAQKLTNLKKMDLSRSFHLKELPDLSNATNLEELELNGCESLVEIPSSFSHLQKIQEVKMVECINLQVTPPQLNWAPLGVDMFECSSLRNFIFISTNSRDVDTSYIEPEDVHGLNRLWPPLESLMIATPANLKGLLTYFPTSLTELSLSFTNIERIPDCIKALHQLKSLHLCGCRRLTSLPELRRSLKYLNADDCESLETVFFPLNRNPHSSLYFTNCFKLDHKSRKEIIKSSFSHGRETIIPEREVPAKFDQRAIGNILTIRLDGNIPLSSLSELQVCLVLSPNHQISKCSGYALRKLLCYRIGKCDVEPIRKSGILGIFSHYRTQHLFMFKYDLQSVDPSEVNREKIVLKFCWDDFGFNLKECGGFDITECGAYIRTKEKIEEISSSEKDFEDETKSSLMGAMSIDGDRTDGVICQPKEEENLKHEEHTDCWSWLFHCFDLSDFMGNIGSLVSGRRG